ncbi:ImmA/IrrE family metallo-endopeptidase [Arthrobacter sp. CJ23]|uniref:ImmA/IrrE family metallo-endopeptidase n=1 Tax=Arthrobacter sp. CJ23 TaxID=2972479 RepID=UPI00215CEB25|nr:ImmA/IrrE family metallo-endopeptidase [Arthrobacter sp. CJ23]UVJ38070.1 ImmA/IrrE family metallo-endopeptidase [Arthrobacter sp. CJ23]
MTLLPSTTITERSVLSSLRSLIPNRTVTEPEEALRVAEWQAMRLLQLHDITDGPIPVELIGELPKVRIEYVELPVSGAAFWDENSWVIQLNRHESWTRQRFTLAHEYKHIIDHNHADRLYTGTTWTTPQEQAERAADHFAGCLLIPKPLLKRVFFGGMQSTRELAEYFNVSEASIRFRLIATGLIDRPQRCAGASMPLNRDWQHQTNQSRLLGA